MIREVSHEAKARPPRQVRVGVATRASEPSALKPDVNVKGQAPRSRREGVNDLRSRDIYRRPQRGEHERSLSPVVAHVCYGYYPLVKRPCPCVPRFVNGHNLTSEEEKDVGQGLPWNTIDGQSGVLRPTELDYHH